MDEVYPLRDAYAADLMHLVSLRDPESAGDPCGLAAQVYRAAYVQDTSAATSIDCGATTFAHELGHTMGLHHDRYQQHDSINNHPYPYSYGYVNQRTFDAGAPASSRWRTLMAYNGQCANAGFNCTQLFRFSNPDQTYAGDPLGGSRRRAERCRGRSGRRPAEPERLACTPFELSEQPRPSPLQAGSLAGAAHRSDRRRHVRGCRDRPSRLRPGPPWRMPHSYR